MSHKYKVEAGYVASPDQMCPVAHDYPKLIRINPGTGDWACNNSQCEYYDGARALFEKKYVKWHKENKTVSNKMKTFPLEITLLEVLTKIRVLESQLFNANEVITELTKPEVNNMWKMAGVSWLARRARYLEETP